MEVAVFEVTAAQLKSISDFSVILNGASTVVFDVDGADAIDNANESNVTTNAGKIIWNF